MPLVNDILTARNAGLKIMFSNQNSTLADMKAAERRFLLPILGQDLLSAMIAAPADQLYAELLPVAQRAEAHLAYWLDLAALQVQISDNGVSSFVNDHRQAAHRWEFDELREMLADKGCEALEEMLEILYATPTAFNWQVPDAYKSIFLTGKDFAKYFILYQPYRTFENLRPYVKQVEDQYVRSLIGDVCFEALRDAASPSDIENKAIAFIKKAVANLTIKTTIEVLPAKISTSGFTVMLQRNPDRFNQGESNAPDPQLSLMYSSVEKSGQSYLTDLKKYLDTTASASVFADYFSSPYYTAPVDPSKVINPNSTRTVFAL